MKYRKLRIAFSASCGILCLLLIVLWVRSYQKCETVTHVRPGFVVNAIGSDGGTLYVLHWMHRPVPTPLPLPGQGRRLTWQPQLGWQYGTSSVDKVPHMFEWRRELIRLPFFLLVALSVAASVTPWLHWRFSLRTLLIAMTLVAVVLGVIVFSIQ